MSQPIINLEQVRKDAERIKRISEAVTVTDWHELAGFGTLLLNKGPSVAAAFLEAMRQLEEAKSEAAACKDAEPAIVYDLLRTREQLRECQEALKEAHKAIHSEYCGCPMEGLRHHPACVKVADVLKRQGVET